MSAAARDAVAADAIIAEINGLTWTQAFVAERYYVRSTDKEDVQTLQVQAQANGSLSERTTRRHRKFTHSVTIVVLKSIDPENKAAVDAMSAFVQDIADYFAQPRGRHKIAGTEMHVTMAMPVSPAPEELLKRQFVAGISLTIEEIVVDS